jgi:pimeloyl-ACP methyl ester carboxylesterase
MNKLLAAAVAALLLMTAMAPPAAAGQPLAAELKCSNHSNPLPDRMTERPVVFVHGWTSSAADSAEAVQMLQDKLGGEFKVYAFDYSDVNTVWGAKGDAKTCLANYLTQASDNFKAGGGDDGKVLAVGHSMGGIVIRAASGVLAKKNKGQILAGAVTIATPMHGSPWGGPTYPKLVEWFQSVSHNLGAFLIPPASSSAGLCLEAPLPGSCERFPYLAEGTKYAAVASQIIIERRLFGLKSMSAEIPIFGDAVVPVPSATGYLSSSEGTYRAGSGLPETVIECKHTSGYLSDQLLSSRVKLGIPAQVIASLLLANVEIFLDKRAMDAMMAGRADPSQFPLFLQGLFSDCFHKSLPTHKDAVQATAGYLKQMSASTQLKTFTNQEMGISFQYPAEWKVTIPTDPRIKTGAEVFGPDGTRIAWANFNTVFDAMCAKMRPYQLLDSSPVSIPGMDTSKAPTTIKTELVDVGSESPYYDDKKPQRLGIALYSGPGHPAGTTEVCSSMALIQSNGKLGFFTANRGFNTAQEAKAYMATQEYRQIKTMLASLRFL